MARLPRKPKLLKYPKKPRASSSASILDRYLDRIKTIDQTNQERLHAYEREMREHELEKRRHQDLVKKIASIGRAEESVKRHRHAAAHHRKKKHAVGKKRSAKRRVHRMHRRR